MNSPENEKNVLILQFVSKAVMLANTKSD